MKEPPVTDFVGVSTVTASPGRDTENVPSGASSVRHSYAGFRLQAVEESRTRIVAAKLDFAKCMERNRI